MENSKIYRVIGTHSGPFHLDDAVAVAIMDLRSSGPITVKRTRDENILAGCDIRIDVGGKYNPSTETYDHHQKGGAGKRENGVPYASAGLIWKDFGKDIVGNEEGFEIVDKKLIQFVDSIDTGTKKHGPETYSLYEVIRAYNLKAEEEGTSIDESFIKAVDFCKDIILSEIYSANRQVKDNVAIRNLLPNFNDKPYVVLEKELAWQPVLVGESDKKYVIFPSDGSVRVRCVPTIVDGFESRQRLPQAWGGLPSADLEKISGVEGTVFCHPGGFIAGAKDIASAIKMAQAAYSTKINSPLESQEKVDAYLKNEN
jgi:uncharacterized UPF0160 family protein